MTDTEPMTEWEKKRAELIAEANSPEHLIVVENRWKRMIEASEHYNHHPEDLDRLTRWGMHGLRHCVAMEPAEILTAIEAVEEYNSTADAEIPEDHEWYNLLDSLVTEHGRSGIEAYVLWLTCLSLRKWDANDFESIVRDHRFSVYGSKAEWAREYTRDTVPEEAREQMRQQLHYVDWAALAEDTTFSDGWHAIDIDGSVFVFPDDPTI